MNALVSDNSKIEGATKARRSPLRRFLIWSFIVCLILCLIAALAAAYVWTHRYALMEDIAIDALAKEGIDGSLSINSVSKTQAVIENISLLENGEEFFSSQKIIADYAWRDMIKGNAQRIVFTRPKGRITIDETGKIIDGWMPHSSDNAQTDQTLPLGGIEIIEGELSVQSPMGTIETHINGEFFAPDNFSAALYILPTKLTYSDWAMNGGGDVNITLKGENPEIKANLQLSTVSHPVLDASDFHIITNMVPVKTGGHITVTGDTDVTFSSLVTAQLMTGKGKMNWSGQITHDKALSHPLTFKGNWESQMTQLSIPDPIRRRDLAQTLSLSQALSKTPIAQNFGPALTHHISQLLEKSNFQGSGRTELNEEGLIIALRKPAILNAQNTTLNLRQTDWGPLYAFDRTQKEVRLTFHADLSKPAGFSLREADMSAHSENGWRLNGVKRFSADISTNNEWKSVGVKNIAARLSPFQAEAVYNGGPSRELRIKGAINYDGSLPGAVVKGLVTGGELTMNIEGGETVMRFVPANDAPLKISRVDTDTQWRAEDVSGRLLTRGPIYRRKENASQITAKLAETAFIAIDLPDKRNLGMSFETLDILAKLNKTAQNWGLVAQNAKICSEDTPGPGTDIRMPDMSLELWREPHKDVRFTMNAPVANAKTQLVTARNLAINASGTPDDFNMEYSPGDQNKGRVKFIGDALPELPMTGIVNYKGGTFTGSARTNLPFGDKTPINVSYNFASGAGTADVDIPQLRFSPTALQPQDLVKALKGKIAEVDGTVSAQIKLAFAAGQPLQSSGTAQLKSMNFGTLPGPLSDVNTELSFSSFFPLQSQGRQTLTVAKFDPGFPLENGVIEFELIPDGVKVYSARWPLGAGAVSLDPFDWLYSAAQNRVVMRMEKVSLGEFLNDVGDGALEATGDIEGVLPIMLSGVDVNVDGGYLIVKDGGTIKYQSKQTNAAGASNEYAKMAFDALQDFNYRSLTAKIDGPLDGAIEVGMEFDGSNKDVLNNQPFRFNINIEGELLNILRSFNTNAQIKSELARRQLERESLPPELE